MGVMHWIAAMVVIFGVTVVFSVMTPILSEHLIPALRPNTSTSGQGVMDFTWRMFLYAPYILVILLFLYAFYASQRREYDSTYDRPG